VDADATVISVGNTTAEHPGSQLVLRTVEREKSAAFTSSHLCAMAALAQVATELGAPLRDGLEALPEQVAAVLEREREVEPVARGAVSRRVYAIGAGPNEATALELVIKAREAALHPVDALATEQFFHGPIVAFNAGDLGIVVNVPGPASARTAQIATALADLGGDLWVVGEGVSPLSQATVFDLPPVPEPLSPLLAVVPMQLFAYHLAATKGTHPDTFRRDDPTYKEAFGLLTL
jgi:glucosamine--fructose-6-phosphate aminotransferase (isomerizing)